MSRPKIIVDGDCPFTLLEACTRWTIIVYLRERGSINHSHFRLRQRESRFWGIRCPTSSKGNIVLLSTTATSVCCREWRSQQPRREIAGFFKSPSRILRPESECKRPVSRPLSDGLVPTPFEDTAALSALPSPRASIVARPRPPTPLFSTSKTRTL